MRIALPGGSIEILPVPVGRPGGTPGVRLIVRVDETDTVMAGEEEIVIPPELRREVAAAILRGIG